MPKKNDTNQCDDNARFHEFFAQCGDGAANQFAAVVNGHDVHACRQRWLYLFNFLLNCIDDIECVFAVTHNDNAANDLAASVQFGDAASDFATQMDVSDILQINRCAIFYLEDDVLDVLNLFDVATAANVIFCGSDLEGFAADVGVARFDRNDDVAERDVVGDKRVWI